MNNIADILKRAFIGLLLGATVGLLFLCIPYMMLRPQLKPKELKEPPEAQHFDIYELLVIRKAAIRNGIQPGTDDWYILLAIRKAENGREGLEFGIMHNEANNLDSQAGWAAATIMKNHERYDAIKYKTDNHAFIEFLGSRYCPIGADNDPDGLNVNWIGNVRYWIKILKGESDG